MFVCMACSMQAPAAWITVYEYSHEEPAAIRDGEPSRLPGGSTRYAVRQPGNRTHYNTSRHTPRSDHVVNNLSSRRAVRRDKPQRQIHLKAHRKAQLLGSNDFSTICA